MSSGSEGFTWVLSFHKERSLPGHVERNTTLLSFTDTHGGSAQQSLCVTGCPLGTSDTAHHAPQPLSPMAHPSSGIRYYSCTQGPAQDKAHRQMLQDPFGPNGTQAPVMVAPC